MLLEAKKRLQGAFFVSKLNILIKAIFTTRIYTEQLHLCCKSHAIHTITNNLIKDLADFHDRLRELAISVYEDYEVALSVPAAEYAKNALSKLDYSDNTDDTQILLHNTLMLIADLALLIEQATSEIESEKRPYCAGVLNALGDISEKLAKYKYLLDMELR